MKLWTRIRKRGRDSERKFINYCAKHNELCVRANDLIYFLLEKRNRPALTYVETKEYRDNIKKIAKYLPIRVKSFLKKLSKQKAYYFGNYKCFALVDNPKIKRTIWDDFYTLPGMPDFAVYDKDRKNVYFVEIKSPRASLYPRQKKLIR